ncbi:hypothetical protein GCM10009836_35700 [Pseudonocardia ailaonensis]|uniref:Luciferase-like domain-containing protein n=1 Tax=Pseudonocardia ailaonensis TaxID=367279 RepID=A0ABN2N4L2_9PSEU
MYLEVVPVGTETLPDLVAYARVAEDAGLDAVGFPLGGALEPTTVLSALAVTTSRVGLVADVSPAYAAPYNVARYLAALDHLSRGRAGWRLVATDPAALADLHGVEPPAAERRARRAAEYAELLPRLWDSWDDDAIPADKERGVYVDEAKIRETRWEGTEFRVHGPLSTPRSPQGHPVLSVEVADAPSRALAAEHAEIVTIGADLSRAADILAGLGGRASLALLALPTGIRPTAALAVEAERAGFGGFRLELDRPAFDRLVGETLPVLGDRSVPAGRTFRERLGLPRPADRSHEGVAA